MTKTAVAFDHVSKRYRRYRSTSLREAVSALPRRFRVRGAGRDPSQGWFWAVKDLSLDIPRGTTMGIIGPNGAGKTTTLKLLSGITQPTSGSIHVDGRVSALIELGAGFHPDLTGRENVFLNGTILGMKRQEIEDCFDSIVAFAELEQFIDTPVKYFSSGMYARLGFAVAAHTSPDVLLVDEVLAVGDYSFQQRCYERMQALRDLGTTVILVSHNLNAVNDICEQVIVLDRGSVVMQASAQEAIAGYAELIRRSSVDKNAIAVGSDGIAQKLMTHEAKVSDVRVLDDRGNPVTMVHAGEWVTIRAQIDFFEDAPHPVFACFVRNESGQQIYDQTTHYRRQDTPSFSAGSQAILELRLQMNVVQGIYQIGMDLAYEDLRCYYDRLESAASLVVVGDDGAKGVADLKAVFQFEWEEQAAEAANVVQP
jgi:ABC-2 type transport system ATP-binding protein